MQRLMQLHRLRLQGIGPYADAFDVDFDRLGASGLFLLEGPTGAGKSTIIDAVVFALYGKVAGEESSDERMHSDFAAANCEPFVELDFSTPHGLFRVRRTPKYERAKQRGTGTTAQNATAKLWRLASPDSPPEEPISTRVDETSAQIQHIVGLSRAQFVQTMVLPQGEFAAFLRAPVDSRREVLQRLFGTEVYDRVQQRLEENRRAALRSREGAQARLRERVATFGGAAGLADTECEALLADDDLPGAGSTLLARLEEHLTRRDDEAAAAARAARAADARSRQAAADLRRATDAEERRRRRQELLRRRANLDGRRDEVAALRVRLALADRAERIRPALVALEQAQSRHESARVALDKAHRLLPCDVHEDDPGGWSAQERFARDVVAQLTPLIDTEASLVATQHELSRLRQQCDEVRGQSAQLQEQLAAAPATLRALQERHVQQLGVAAHAADLQARVAQLTAAARTALTLEDVAADVVEHERLATRCGSAAKAAQKTEARLRTRYLDDCASELALRLVDGQPCLVCGSATHPAPATPTPSSVTRADVDRAETLRVQQVAAYEDARAELDRLRVHVAELRATTAGRSVDEVRRELSEARAALESCDEATRQAVSTAEKIATHEGEQQRLRERLVALGDRERKLDVAHGTLATDITRAVAQIEAARGEHGSVSERVEALRDRAAALARAVTADAALQTAASALTHASDNFAAWCDEASLAGRAAVVEALLDRGECDRLTATVNEYDCEGERLAGALADPTLADVPSEPVDLEPLTQAALQAQEADDRAGAAAAQAQDVAGRARTCSAQVAEALEQHAAELARTAPVIRMANLVAASTADNARAMTLATYVLLERFHDVVAAANERLAVMSDGRYALEHVQERSGNRRAGLGLAVFDGHTEARRDPRTLSGGETFYCSLSLALGLADVVTSEAGGIQLGTLFVDEGFGSLDPDTLDQVMAVLSRLRASGRVVGIVSHVPELKERVVERVVVRRTPEGHSRLDVVA